MSGHSKWAKIHRQKSVSDAKKGVVFTRLGNAITIAARLGGGDAEMNFKLKLAIDKAKAANMPKENIERAIRRGTGEDAEKKIEEVTYEGFGPGGAAFVISCYTDSRNRTASTLKHLFSEHGGALGAPNSVLWQFESRGTLGIQNASLSEQQELELIDQGVVDIEKEGNTITLSCLPQNTEKIKKYLESLGISTEFAEIELVPKNTVGLSDEKSREKLERFIAELESYDEVNNYYTNAKF